MLTDCGEAVDFASRGEVSMSRAGLIVLLLMLGLVLVVGTSCTRCGKSVAEQAVESAVEKATGGRADIDVGGSIDLSGLPAFLHYPGATAKARWGASDKGATGTVYAFETKDPAESVIDFYRKALAGWKNLSTMQSGDATVLVYGSEDDMESVTVTVSRDDDQKTTSLTLLYAVKTVGS
jgi:hypothetical protein